MCEKPQRDTTNFLVLNMSAKPNTQQNFDEQDITSGFIMNLIKLTQQNIRLAKQTTNNERESYEKETRRIQT